MADLTLYTNPMSRGRIARWMLEEIGQSYAVRYLDYGPEMKAPDYLALNPMGKVPTLVHGTAVVTEAAAICAYLADAFPEAGMAPAREARAEYYRWLFFAAGPVEAAMTNRTLGLAAADRTAMLGYGSYEAVLDALSGLLTTRDWVTDAFSAADVYVGAQVDWGLAFGTMEERPGLAAYAERLRSRLAYQRAKAADDAAMPTAE
jgi:glutathione S-transferase